MLFINIEGKDSFLCLSGKQDVVILSSSIVKRLGLGLGTGTWDLGPRT